MKILKHLLTHIFTLIATILQYVYLNNDHTQDKVNIKTQQYRRATIVYKSHKTHLSCVQTYRENLQSESSHFTKSST